MFLDKGFPHPLPSFPRPVPGVLIDPGSGTLVCAAFNVAWLPYVLGALTQLALPSTWDIHDPALLQTQLGRVQDLISLFSGVCTVEPQFRQPDDCSLEVSLDAGATWSAVYNALACATGAADNAIADAILGHTIAPYVPPPLPVEPPAPAECQSYHVQLDASRQWVLPSPVAMGDTITVSNVNGASFDGTVFGWAFADGYQDVLGTEGAQLATDPGDPFPTVSHQRLIMRVGPDYADAYNAGYTVPSGLTSANVAFQINDGTLADNQGTIEFDVLVCTAAAISPLLCGVLTDVRELKHGLVENVLIPGNFGPGFNGVWESGIGFEPLWHDYGGGADYAVLSIEATGMAPFTPDQIFLSVNNLHPATYSEGNIFIQWRLADGTLDASRHTVNTHVSQDGNVEVVRGGSVSCTLTGCTGFLIGYFSGGGGTPPDMDRWFAITHIQLNCC